MTIQKARTVLSPGYDNRTDEEIQAIIDTLKTLINITIDTVIEMFSDERKNF